MSQQPIFRDDTEKSPNVWKFYGSICEQEHYYLLIRIFLDAVVGFLGLGAAFWTKKGAFAMPCAFVQPLLVFGRYQPKLCSMLVPLCENY